MTSPRSRPAPDYNGSGNLGSCRDCGAQVLWVVTVYGKNQPLDPEPNSTGHVVMEGDRARTLNYRDRDRAVRNGETIWRSHFASCAGKRKSPPKQKPESLVEARTKGYNDGLAVGRKQGYDKGYDKGYAHGLALARSFDADLLRSLIALTHPDRHPPERYAEANRVTAELIALRGKRP